MGTGITVFDVANYFLNRVDRNAGAVMTHLKLQKLVYYAQAWHLVFYGKKLFPGDFQAWAHGPANWELYDKYRDASWRPIETVEPVPAGLFTDEQEKLLDEVWSTYGKFDAKFLERLTHQERPWREARGDCDPSELCYNIISPDAMKEYYSALLEDEAKKQT